MKTKIYIMTHKRFNNPKFEEYVPFLVGKKNNKLDIYEGDDRGDNISEKNANYCELTGLYWIWKNDKESDIVGISHYRRYFTKQKIFRNTKKIIRKDYIENILNNYDIILPKKEIYKETAIEQYCLSSGFKKDLDKIRCIIEEKYPDYVESYYIIMNQNKMYQFNMLISKKKIYDDYCNWLFNILFELEKNVDLSDGYNDYQKRIYGFISERLLNVWVLKNNLMVKEVRVVNPEMSLKECIKIFLRRYKNAYIFKKNKEK